MVLSRYLHNFEYLQCNESPSLDSEILEVLRTRVESLCAQNNFGGFPLMGHVVEQIKISSARCATPAGIDLFIGLTIKMGQRDFKEVSGARGSFI